MAQNYGSTDVYESRENIQNLIVRIKNNLQNLRQITRDLGDLCSLLGGPHDSSDKRKKIMQHQQRAKDLLILTKSLFETISQLKSNEETTRLAIIKVKEDYDNVVPKYNEMHKNVVAKLSQIVIDARNVMSISVLEREDSVENMDAQLVKDDAELEAAEAVNLRVQQIEKDLFIVQNLYTDINQIVVENQEQVKQIEMNIVNASEDVDKANDELGNAITYKRKAFKKKICIIVIVLIILLIIGLIIGFSVRPNK